MKTKTPTPVPIIQIELDNYLNWLYSDNGDYNKDNVINMVKNGVKPVRQKIKTSVCLFLEYGYLPARFVKNFSKIRNNRNIVFKSRLDPKWDSEITSGSRFVIEWI